MVRAVRRRRRVAVGVFPRDPNAMVEVMVRLSPETFEGVRVLAKRHDRAFAAQMRLVLAAALNLRSDEVGPTSGPYRPIVGNLYMGKTMTTFTVKASLPRTQFELLRQRAEMLDISFSAQMRDSLDEGLERFGVEASPTHVEIPAWVERAGLVEDYCDIAMRLGEEEAAGHCRRLKRMAMAA